MLLDHVLWKMVNIEPYGMTMTRGSPDSNSTLLVWRPEAPCSEHQMLRLPLLALNLLLDAPRPIYPSETTIGYRGGVGTDPVFGQRLHDMPPALPSLIVPCGHRATSRGEQSLQNQLTELRTRLESAEADDPALTAALNLTLSADAKWGLPDQLRTRLIEYSVALESLLLDQEAELSYRFALRLSALLAPAGERLQVFDQARTVYKLRSNAVHAGARAIRISDIEVDTTRRLLHLSILRYLGLRHAELSRKAILDLLDRALLSQLAAQELSVVLTDETLWPVESVD
jgi:Apea-like HEPN